MTTASDNDSAIPVRLRLRTRLLIGILIVEAMLMSATGLVVENRMSESILNEFEKRGLSVTRNLAAISSDFIVTYNYLKIDQNLERVVRENDLLYATVVFYDGEIAGYIGDEALKPKVLSGPLYEDAQEISETLMRCTTVAGQALCDIAVPILRDGEYWGTIRTGFSLVDMHVAIFKTRIALAALGIIGLLCGWLASLFLARRITQPISNLVDSVQAIARGHYQEPIKVTSRDEIGFLGQRFAQMQKTIRSQFEQLEERNQTLSREVIERQKKEQALIESEARLGNAQRIAKLGFWEWNRNADVLLWSEEINNLLDMPRRNTSGRRRQLLAFVPKEERRQIMQTIIQAATRKQNASIEHKIVRADGAERIVDHDIEVSFDETGAAVKIVGTVQDITERKRAIERIHYLAYYDNVTGLPNRTMLGELLQQWLRHAEHYQRALAVLYLDLDHFNRINDTFGHKAGDELLRQVAARLTICVRDTRYILRERKIPLESSSTSHSNNTIARLGGDEFVIVLSELDQLANAASAAQRVQKALVEPFVIHGVQVFVTTSIGISGYPADGRNAEDLLKHADMAMYHAKNNGRDTYQFFASSMNAYVRERLSLENELRNSIKQNHFEVYYQPKADIRTGCIVGMEALLRWNHPQRGFIPPAKFIPIAEETGLIVPLGGWVMRTACAQARAWQQANLPPLRISVNLSTAQFKARDLQPMILDTLNDTGLVPECLELELTESLLMDNVAAAIPQMEELKAIGLHLSIDDFGTGYSSLSYLKRFPIDVLKIDRSFVRDITEDSNDAAIVMATIALGHNLGLSVIAEGVEKHAQLELLQTYRCDQIQGNFLSKPLPASDFQQLLMEQEVRYASAHG